MVQQAPLLVLVLLLLQHRAQPDLPTGQPQHCQKSHCCCCCCCCWYLLLALQQQQLLLLLQEKAQPGPPSLLQLSQQPHCC
jgi:hypothetical protein